MVKSYKLLYPREIGGTYIMDGSTVYEFLYDDFGLAADEERIVGYPIVSVTLNPTGAYSSFTVPRGHLEEWRE